MEVEDTNSGYIVAMMSPEKFQHYWPEIEGMLDRVPHTWEDLTKDAICSRIMNETLSAWSVEDKDHVLMVLFTQIATYASGRVLEIVWAAGQGKLFDLAGDALDTMFEEFARIQKCRRIDIIGREGWEKVLAKRGFRRVAVVLSRHISLNGKRVQ